MGLQYKYLYVFSMLFHDFLQIFQPLLPGFFQQSLFSAIWKNRNIPPYGAGVRKNIADVILEFHGIARNNPEIADFLADQLWYPVKTPRQIDGTYKQMLLKISEGK